MGSTSALLVCDTQDCINAVFYDTGSRVRDKSLEEGDAVDVW